MTVIQRTPNLGIGIRLQPLTPAVAKAEVPEPATTDTLIIVSTGTSTPSGAPIVHTVLLSKTFDTPKNYSWTTYDTTAMAGIDYAVPTDADLSDGVTTVAGELIVPAGVSSFTMTVGMLGSPIAAPIQYEVRIGIQIGLNYGMSVGEGVIFPD